LKQIFGTQIIGPKYHFTNEDPIVEGAKRLISIGSTIIKFKFSTLEQFDVIASLPFEDIIIWFDRINVTLEIEEDDTYDRIYRFAEHLFKHYGQTHKRFFIGHWEGDWLLNSTDLKQESATVERCHKMIKIQNIRQTAVDSAKEKHPDSGVDVYNYVEINRVIDHIDHGLRRFVDGVLPYINPDFVSYSAYDIQKLSINKIHEVLDFVESKLRPKEKLPYGKRIFIGEFGIPAFETNFEPMKHKKANIEILKKFVSWGCPYVLYWELFNNELFETEKNGHQKGSHIGFWLIDDMNREWPLYQFLKSLNDKLVNKAEVNAKKELLKMIEEE
jgi:hypothetical protein